MSLDRMNAASLALCYAKAILDLLTQVTGGQHHDAIHAALHFVEEAKDLIDNPPRPSESGIGS